MSFTWPEHGEALQWALQGYNTRSSTTASSKACFYDPSLSANRSRLATATRTIQGGTAFGIYPFNRYRRIECSAASAATRRVQRSGARRSRRALPAGATAGSCSTTATWCRRRGVRAGDDDLPRVRAAVRQHDAPVVRGRAEDRQHALAADVRRRRAQDTSASAHRPAGAARPRLQELGRQSRLHLLRRQHRAARLRVPVVHRPERVLRQRGAALPADRRDGHADRHARRRARPPCSPASAARTSRAVPFKLFNRPDAPAADVGYTTTSANPVSGRPHGGTGCASSTAAAPTASASRPSRSASRCTSTGRGGRCSTGSGKTSPSTCQAAARTFRGQVHDVDWLRLVGSGLRPIGLEGQIRARRSGTAANLGPAFSFKPLDPALLRVSTSLFVLGLRRSTSCGTSAAGCRSCRTSNVNALLVSLRSPL